MRTPIHAAAGISMLALWACALQQGASPNTDLVPVPGRVVVNVNNDYGLPVDVWARTAGTAYRMGTVAPGIVGYFLLREVTLASGGGMVELVAQPAGTEPPVRSGRLLLRDGEVVEFEVTSHLIASYASVR
jgi:hypothetical protein